MALWQWHASRYSDLWSWGSPPTRGSVSGPLLRSAGDALQPAGGDPLSEVSVWEAWVTPPACGAAAGRHSSQGGRARKASSLLPAPLGTALADLGHCSCARVRRLTVSSEAQAQGTRRLSSPTLSDECGVLAQPAR